MSQPQKPNITPRRTGPQHTRHTRRSSSAAPRWPGLETHTPAHAAAAPPHKPATLSLTLFGPAGMPTSRAAPPLHESDTGASLPVTHKQGPSTRDTARCDVCTHARQVWPPTPRPGRKTPAAAGVAATQGVPQVTTAPAGWLHHPHTRSASGPSQLLARQRFPMPGARQRPSLAMHGVCERAHLKGCLPPVEIPTDQDHVGPPGCELLGCGEADASVGTGDHAHL